MKTFLGRKAFALALLQCLTVSARHMRGLADMLNMRGLMEEDALAEAYNMRALAETNATAPPPRSLGSIINEVMLNQVINNTATDCSWQVDVDPEDFTPVLLDTNSR